MNPLFDILQRNQGSVLTQELITGILVAHDQAMADSIYSSVPTRLMDQPIKGDSRLVVDDHPRVGRWVADRIGQAELWGNFTAIGLLNPDGELIAGTVVESRTETNAFVHVAFANRYALKRVLIRAFFEYVFIQLGLKRITGLVSAENTDALLFDQHLGFELEHTIPCGDGNGDIHMLVLWRDKCRWLN